MNSPSLSMSRRHILGALYPRCEEMKHEIPVFVSDGDEAQRAIPVLAGHAEQTLDYYADAVTFHLSPEHCKQLSAGYFSYEFELEFVNPADHGSRSRVRLNSISLIARTNYTKPVPRGTLGHARRDPGHEPILKDPENDGAPRRP